MCGGYGFSLVSVGLGVISNIIVDIVDLRHSKDFFIVFFKKKG